MLLAFVPAAVLAQPAVPQDPAGLPGFRTVETAITTTIKKSATTQIGSPGYLGVLVEPAKNGAVTVAEVADASPAAKAGVQVGDVVRQVDGRAVQSPEVFRSLLQTKSGGEKVILNIVRNGKAQEVTATLTATSRVMQLGQKRAAMGVTVEEPKDGDGVALKTVVSGAPADKAGLKAGDVILKLDGRAIDTASFNSVLLQYQPGDAVKLLVKAQGKDKDTDVKVTLAADTDFPTGKGKGKGGGFGGGGAGAGWDNRTNTWKKDTYRLAIVCIEYPDVKHNAKITAKNWEDSLFSAKTYTTSSVTGQKVFGSMNDYYQEQSFNRLKVTGKCFDFVTVSKKRSEYAAANTGPQKTALLGEALDALLKRDGKDCLKNFDGIFFLYAGGRVQTNRGGLYWPHKSFFTHQGQRWPYFIVQEGGDAMCDISVICHEFGHMLGLPDLYARPENPGSEGAGAWCAMSNQAGRGKPQHFSAWSKEQLGWVTPAVIDPTVRQKLVLSPIEDSPKECFKVLARPDGGEYFLLENRKRKGFDSSLPAEGLLIWRILGNRPILEESHGIDGPQGPRVFTDAVPFPSIANNAFTPFTTPSSRAQLGGGLPVHITNIRKLPDGRVTFYVGYEYY
jgi:M6 family metalloprotease-like protein